MADTEINTDRKFEPVRVTCYSGYKADEQPIAFDFQGRRWEISKILDRWYEGSMSPEAPIINYFKVRATCAAREDNFILQYWADTHAWAVLIRDPA